MGDTKGYLKYPRKGSSYRTVGERVGDYRQVFDLRSNDLTKEQSARCMDCGTPFCHSGCPIGNYIPEWNDLIFNRRWRRAYELLEATNILPEVTGRVCPATCEYACVLGINDEPITIRENELGIIEHAFMKGWVVPQPPTKRSGKRVAVIGSGPAGLAAAVQLNRAGHQVTVFERDPKIGGIMRYGIPDFKLEKKVLDRRIEIWKQEGIEFKTGNNISSIDQLTKEFNAVCLAGGSRVPRDLKVEGRELKGTYFAMEYLTQSNRRIAGEKIAAEQLIDAKGKRVVVIGGGDTGSDCVGTAHRQGAAAIIQLELLPKPPEKRPLDQPWPKYPIILKTSSSHEEGGERHWSVMTKKIIGENGHLKKVICAKVDPCLKEVPGSEFVIEADLILLAMGFLHPEHTFTVEYDQRGNIKTNDNYRTSVKGVFAAGDMRRGQSLIVWAIAEGRRAAYGIDSFLMGKSDLLLM